eukprot:scaffold401_cov399-Prasinococcus_capsulatus_cf.AAC.23
MAGGRSGTSDPKARHGPCPRYILRYIRIQNTPNDGFWNVFWRRRRAQWAGSAQLPARLQIDKAAHQLRGSAATQPCRRRAARSSAVMERWVAGGTVSAVYKGGRRQALRSDRITAEVQRPQRSALCW